MPKFDDEPMIRDVDPGSYAEDLPRDDDDRRRAAELRLEIADAYNLPRYDESAWQYLAGRLKRR